MMLTCLPVKWCNIRHKIDSAHHNIITHLILSRNLHLHVINIHYYYSNVIVIIYTSINFKCLKAFSGKTQSICSTLKENCFSVYIIE